MKIKLVLLFLFATQLAWGQKIIEKTNEIRISGRLKTEKTVTLAELANYKSVKIKDVAITNHLGEKKGKARNMKGILLKDILNGLELQEESPKKFSEFYFVFVASDGYKVVFSWNEIFNTATGRNLYIVVEKDGKRLADMEDRILIISPTDFQTGRRYVKGLSKILVNRIE